MVRRTLTILLAFALWWDSSLAGNTGKVAGTIKAKQTGEPLFGTNVILKGTKLGTSTDTDGRYYILQVPPGTYEVKVSYIGYQSVIIKDVKVQVDLTTEVNAALQVGEVFGPAVVVTAERKMVQKDVTSTRRTVTRESALSTPTIESTTDIFKLQVGSLISVAPQVLQLGDGTQLQVRDESLKDIHVRGGRGGELLYMVDGIPVTHPIYGGRSVMELNMVDVEQVELLTGAFNAEYGQAQSGVVNITTRRGGEQFSGGVEYRTDWLEFLGEAYQTHSTWMYAGGPVIPGTLDYFLSANANLTNTPYNNKRDRETISLLGMKIKEEQENTGNLNSKLTWEFTGDTRLVTSYQGSWRSWSDFNWFWRYFPNNTADYGRKTHNLTTQFNHVLSHSTFYNVSFGFLSVNYNGSLRGKTPADFWTIIPNSTGTRDSITSTIVAPQLDPLTGFFDYKGFENIWRDDLSRTYTFKGDITSQVDPEHLVKGGVEVRYNDISYVDIQDGGVKLSNYGEYLYRNGPYYPLSPGPFPEFGQNRWVFHVKPLIGSLYIQDKFEREMLILNAGFRLDWFDLGNTVMRDDWKNQWKAATGLNPDWKRSRYIVSPRFGISFPISERTVVFFSYGHFVQLPELQYYYRDPWSGSFTGNPKLDYEQTILYEFGFTHQFADEWAVDIKSYAKDISRQVGTTRLRAALGVPVDLYDNNGYARARGMEVELTKAYSDYTSGKIAYTVQWANGYSSSAFEDYIRSINDFPNPIRERPLQWDIRHQIILQASLSSAKDSPIEVFGMELPDDWNLTILSRFSGGQPYTPGTLDPAERQVKENSATSPPTSSTDIRFIKSFSLFGMRVSFVVDVFNLFDQKNAQIYYSFNTWTGKPFRYSDTVPPTNQYYDWYTMFRLMDPRQFSTGRTAKIGLRVDW